jgi:hypothetical protein
MATVAPTDFMPPAAASPGSGDSTANLRLSAKRIRDAMHYLVPCDDFEVPDYDDDYDYDDDEAEEGGNTAAVSVLPPLVVPEDTPEVSTPPMESTVLPDGGGGDDDNNDDGTGARKRVRVAFQDTPTVSVIPAVPRFTAGSALATVRSFLVGHNLASLDLDHVIAALYRVLADSDVTEKNCRNFARVHASHLRGTPVPHGFVVVYNAITKALDGVLAPTLPEWRLHRRALVSTVATASVDIPALVTVAPTTQPLGCHGNSGTTVAATAGGTVDPALAKFSSFTFDSFLTHLHTEAATACRDRVAHMAIVAPTMYPAGHAVCRVNACMDCDGTARVTVDAAAARADPRVTRTLAMFLKPRPDLSRQTFDALVAACDHVPVSGTFLPALLLRDTPSLGTDIVYHLLRLQLIMYSVADVVMWQTLYSAPTSRRERVLALLASANEVYPALRVAVMAAMQGRVGLPCGLLLIQLYAAMKDTMAFDVFSFPMLTTTQEHRSATAFDGATTVIETDRILCWRSLMHFLVVSTANVRCETVYRVVFLLAASSSSPRAVARFLDTYLARARGWAPMTMAPDAATAACKARAASWAVEAGVLVVEPVVVPPGVLCLHPEVDAATLFAQPPVVNGGRGLCLRVPLSYYAAWLTLVVAAHLPSARGTFVIRSFQELETAVHDLCDMANTDL